MSRLQELSVSDSPQGRTGPGGVRRAYVRNEDKALALADAVDAAMAEAGYGRHDRFGLQLGLIEALANALKHGREAIAGCRRLIRNAKVVSFLRCVRPRES